ncbi:two-component system sensor histidine kinase NtrB [Cohnella mopanensis]|uniref:two-component system sensor histidine kinase NtrB n=1 Tax=Cohnella mopanensis TaxID=2911966 RepID=UPI001EF7AB56|nr:ATP-binding protein [Cohnella mopanensis]
MLKDSLLQVLIAFLPVCCFMAWYSKPEQTRYSNISLGLACVVAMVLNMRFSIINEHGVNLDLRHIPFIIGSLYGGLPVAVLLLIVYTAAKLSEMSTHWAYIIFAIFLLTFIPLLYSRISVFQGSSRRGKLKIAAFLCLLLSILQGSSYFTSLSDFEIADLPEHLRVVLVFGALFISITLVCVHYTELCYDRIQLQLQLHDVSKKYRNEMRRLQQFIDNTPLMVIFCDNNGVITRINDVALKFVAPLGRNDILYQKFSLFMDKMNVQFEKSPVERVLRGEDKITEIIRLHGRTFYTVSCPIKDLPSQGTDGVLFIGHDVTELQRLKDEVDRMERLSLVGQMAASITHEIRNPMAVIRGFVQLLNERSPEEQKSYFRIVIDELDRANSIINDFLSLAQNRIVEKEPSNLNDLLNDILPLIWADANLRGQMIDLRLGEEMEQLPMNSKEMKQLILNLARNGMEAMNDKGVLRIETLNLQESIQLRMVDSGVGIPQEQLERLFEPFYTTKTNGTGLGLALCFSIVERHNGKIHVESTIGQGTTFIVTFSKLGKVS